MLLTTGRRLTLATGVVASFALFSGACSTAKKSTPELSKLHGKTVALVEVDGEPTARQVAEVALINELVRRGTFTLIPKQDVQAARTRANVDTTDWKAIGQAAGAQVSLRIQVLTFRADEHEGYSSEKVFDSQLAEERGKDDATTERLFKVKSLAGSVRFRIQYADGSDVRTGETAKEETVTAEARTEAAHLPPRLRFLEKLSGEAFRDFFDRYE